MSEPRVDAPGPLLQIQLGERRAINLLQSQQNITHFPLRMASNPTIGLKAIHSSPKLHPHGRLPDRTHLSEEWMPRALRSLSTILRDEKERLRRDDPSILSRKSDAAWRDH